MDEGVPVGRARLSISGLTMVGHPTAFINILVLYPSGPENFVHTPKLFDFLPGHSSCTYIPAAFIFTLALYPSGPEFLATSQKLLGFFRAT